jgi:chaperonin cofactor prefoldin
MKGEPVGSDRSERFGPGCAVRIRTAVMLGLFLSAGPASYVLAAAAPDWVNGSDKKYPSALYLTGVGYADTRQAAEDRAYAAISKIFAAEINSKTLEWEKYLQSDAKEQAEDKRQISIEQATQVSTKKVLENVGIAETWLDSSKAVYYALAVMDRQHAASALRDRITALDLKVEELLKQTRQSGEKLQTVRAYHGAVQNLLLREAYNAELRVVSPTGRGSESGVSLADVNRDFRSYLAKNFIIIVEIVGENGEPIRAAIVEGLNRQGLPVAADSDLHADLTVKGTVSLEPVQMPGTGSTKFVRWSAAFEVTDLASQQVIGSVAKQGREGHLTMPEAEARALRTAGKEVSDEVGRQLAEFIYGKEEP